MLTETKLAQRLGGIEVNEGRKIDPEDITYIDSERVVNGGNIHYFVVDDYRYYGYNNVYVISKDDELRSFGCNCRQYYSKGTCKHIAACIIRYQDKIFSKPKDAFEIGADILKGFISDKPKKNTIKEALRLEIELNFEDLNPSFKLMVGLKKTYVLNSETKFTNFINSYRNEEEYQFGVNFTYDPDKHYFKDSDLEILEFLNGYKKTNNYYSYYNRDSMFELSNRELEILLEKLENKQFKIKNYGLINSINYGLPTEIRLNLDNNNYKLDIEDFNKYFFVDKEYKYVAFNNELYVIDNKYSKFIEKMYENNLSELKFKKEDVNLFKEGLLSKIKDNIKIDEKITDIVISKEPVASLYLDLNRDKIVCDIKLDYNGNIINYFDENTVVVRETDYEDRIINKLLELNFIIDKKKIYLDNIDEIGYFLTEGITKLSEEYKVFTSKKIDNTSILKKSNITSNFSIGKDGIMKYEFNTDNIDLSELNSVLTSLKNKKKYYRLKNGNIIDLNNNDELNELSNIINDLELSNQDLENGNIEIPKYRAFYIDSLKQNNYKSINTDNSFDKFITNFKKYKNTTISLDKKDEETLRNYQKDGVKWLYTLYKCDLGGILADEMGLGKSIQTICFIKQILKEKEDAKIMIVCPTSLVYNWKKEFDKFAPELKYTTVAETKSKRKEIMNHFDDYNVFITSYGLIRNDNDEYENREFELCVIDEAQAIKNYQANMTKEIKKIKARTKIALTGTPLENSVLELWSIFDFIMPGYLNSILKFKENYGIKDVDEASLEKLTKLNYQIKPFILRRKKNEVTKDLPDKLENNIYLELGDIQKAIYLKVLKESKEEMDELIRAEGFQKARFKILQLLMKLRQICIDPNILYSNYKEESVKMEKLIEIVKNYVAENHKILIFSSFKTVIDRVKEKFDKENISSYMISGEVKSKTRMELVDKFNNDDTNCFLITLKSGGTGLNLTGADIVIHLDIWWNPQVENQATDRAHRIGQTKKVTVIKLITKGTVEERILELQNKKKILSDNLIEGKNDSETLSSLSEKEIKNLLAYGED